MRIIFIFLVILVVYSTAQAKDVQLFNPDVFGQATSTAIKLLYDKKPNEIEPYMVSTDIKCGKYDAASVFYRKNATFAEVRASLNKLYKNYENLSLFQDSQSAHWRVDDKRFAISLSQEGEGVVRVMYIQFRPIKGAYKDYNKSPSDDKDAFKENECED